MSRLSNSEKFSCQRFRMPSLSLTNGSGGRENHVSCGCWRTPLFLRLLPSTIGSGCYEFFSVRRPPPALNSSFRGIYTPSLHHLDATVGGAVICIDNLRTPIGS